MAHFAKISEENEVLTVVVVDDRELLDGGVETESVGQAYLEKHNNWPAHLWIQTSYNTHNNQHAEGGAPLRGNYATVGSTWDAENQVFWPPQPAPSWVKDIPNKKWTSPIGDEPALTAEQQSQIDAGTHWWAYSWNEDNQTWDLMNHLA